MSTAERRRFTERVGAVRPSQLVYTFGVGSVVDLPNFSVVVGGLDRWERESTTSLHEPRLLAAARVLVGQQLRELRTPPWIEETSSAFDEWARVGVPVYPFPRWLRCTECGRLAPYTGPHGTFTLKNDAVRVDQIRFVHDGCPRKRGRRSPPAIPARFHVACERGHLDEFPWIEFAHLTPAVHRQPGARALRGAGRDALHGHARAVHDLRGEAAPLACVRRAGGADDAAVSGA